MAASKVDRSLDQKTSADSNGSATADRRRRVSGRSTWELSGGEIAHPAVAGRPSVARPALRRQCRQCSVRSRSTPAGVLAVSAIKPTFGWVTSAARAAAIRGTANPQLRAGGFAARTTTSLPRELSVPTQTRRTAAQIDRPIAAVRSISSMRPVPDCCYWQAQKGERHQPSAGLHHLHTIRIQIFAMFSVLSPPVVAGTSATLLIRTRSTSRRSR